MEPHGQIVEKATGEMDKSKVRPDVKKVLGFRMEINYRLSAWDRLDAEPEPFVLANLLLTWMEHLKSPILDQVVKGDQVCVCVCVCVCVIAVEIAALYLFISNPRSKLTSEAV